MATNVRDMYVNGMVNTAGRERLLLLLLDRLRLDVHRAADAQRSGRYEEAGRQLIHAQDIVVELRATLRVDTWVGGPGLSAVYDYLFTLLVTANVKRDVNLTQESLSLIEPLVEAWREAATTASAS